jgi:hypothetical protein
MFRSYPGNGSRARVCCSPAGDLFLVPNPPPAQADRGPRARAPVGGGTHSAIEVALALCENNRVFLSCRVARLDPVEPKHLKPVEAAIAAGKCEPRTDELVEKR